MNDKKQNLGVAKITFNIPLTMDEAKQIVTKPKGNVAKEMRKYLQQLLEHAAQVVLDSKSNVKDCNIPIPEDLKKPTE